jgi:hypothetical protein
MPTAKTKYGTRKALMDYYVYAPLGAGQLAVEKTREFAGKAAHAAESQRKVFFKTYEKLAQRGEKLVKSVQKSVYTRRAAAQIRTARSQAKGATTSIRKAAGSTATAGKAAAKKVG